MYPRAPPRESPGEKVCGAQPLAAYFNLCRLISSRKPLTPAAPLWDTSRKRCGCSTQTAARAWLGLVDSWEPQQFHPNQFQEALNITDSIPWPQYGIDIANLGGYIAADRILRGCIFCATVRFGGLLFSMPRARFGNLCRPPQAATFPSS